MNQQQQQLSGETSAADFVTQYAAVPGVYDEFLSEPSAPREHWEYLRHAVATMGAKEVESRAREIQRLLREGGIDYLNTPEAKQPRFHWKLDPIPALYTSREWNDIELGLFQRAELFSKILTDLYGPREVINKGVIPTEIILANPAYLRACQINRTLNRFNLFFYSADLVRLPDGSLRVLNNLTQVPSGIGYALKNRMIMARIFPSLFRDSRVHRLANYYRQVRKSLMNLAEDKIHTSQIVALTSGVGNPAFSEQVFLAEYLGLPLVQSGDLTVRDRQVMLKTLDGLQPVRVIFRHIADLDSDPLHLNSSAMNGLPGLVHSSKLGRVIVANPLGSGILESPALSPFLPVLCKHFLGEELKIPPVQTWWCGDPVSQSYVIDNLERMVVKTIDSSSVFIGTELGAQEKETLAAKIRTQPYFYVGEEITVPSTTPVFRNGALEPGYMAMRSYLVSNEKGYSVMPGGFTRIASTPEGLLRSTHYSETTKDTWLLASEPEIQIDLPDAVSPAVEVRHVKTGIPSRIAENLFWLGRYAERTESNARLMRELVKRLLDTEYNDQAVFLPYLVKALEQQTGNVRQENEKVDNSEEYVLNLIFEQTRVGSIPFNINALTNTARSVKDRLSQDALRFISELNIVHHYSKDLTSALACLERIIAQLSGLAGLIAESMSRGQGYIFLDIGKRIERGLNSIHLIQSVFSAEKSINPVMCEVILEIADSIMTYRRRYRIQPHVAAVLDLLLLDETNPRSVGYQIERLNRRVQLLPSLSDEIRHTPEQRLALQALTLLRTTDFDALSFQAHSYPAKLSNFLQEMDGNLTELSDGISQRYFNLVEKVQHFVDIA